MDIALKDIWIDRPSRQRKEIVVDDLLASIPLRGVLVPVIVVSESGPAGQPYKLLAGERRYTASSKLGLQTIPARLLSDLSPIDQRVVELEENLRRKDLEWQDQCQAIATIHEIMASQAPDEWSFAKTADAIGYGHSWVQRCVRISRELHRDNIKTLDTATRAYNFIQREDERVASDAISNILSTASEAIDDLLTEPPKEGEAPKPESAKQPPLVTPSEQSILQQSFIEWADAYRGEPFNLIHCDFPYGVNVFGGPWSGKRTWSNYDDGADVYIRLIEALCRNLDRIMAHSGHLVFWLSGDIKIQARTLEMFSELAPTLAFCNFP